MSVGENIRSIRIKKGMTQKSLAEKSGLYDSQVRRYELGNSNPKLETIKKIAAALEVPYTDLLPVSIDTPGNKRVTQAPRIVTEAEALQSTITLLDYAGCDISLSVDEMKRIMEVTKELHKALIKDFKEHSNYKIIK